MEKNDISLIAADINLDNKINNLYRLAEFGRISAGIFHDLINPLTIVSLNLEQLNKLRPNQNIHKNEFYEINKYLSQAIMATKKMEDLIICIKRCLNQADVKSFFVLENEIVSAIKILNYQAIKNNIKIIFKNKISTEEYYGNPTKFNQIIYNLLSNAIQSCSQQKLKERRKIRISLTKEDKKIIIKVSDCGPGIKKEHLNKIFLPFFSTKNSCGLGLYITKCLTEKDFLGEIKINSQINKKTVFSIIIPKINQDKKGLKNEKAIL